MIGTACIAARLAFMAVLLAMASRLAAANAEESGSRAATASEMQAIQNYSRSATDKWMESNLGLSLSDLELVWDPATLTFKQRSALDRQAAAAERRRGQAAPAGSSTSAGVRAAKGVPQKSFSLSLQQSNDLRQLSRDLRDLPFGVEVKGDLPVLARLTALETRLWVPFSWRDEWRAEASLPLAWPGAKNGLWKEMGFSKKLSLRSDYSNRLGRNQVEAGLGTDWSNRGLGTWSVDYDVHMKYGQGESEAIHWLKLSKEF